MIAYSFVNTEKQKLNFSSSALFHMKTRVTLKYLLNDYLWKHFFHFNSPPTLPNLISLTILVTLRHFTRFQSKVRQIKLHKSAKLGLS